MTNPHILLISFGGLNLFTFLVFGWDKMSALLGWRRVPERTLLTLACVGGSVGALFGMWLFRHKISKDSFQFPLVIILLVQLGVVIYLIDYLVS